MAEFLRINLNELLENIGEDRTKDILSSFSCPLNKDVELFLHEKSIHFSKMGRAKTHLIFWKQGNEKELIGYFSIASKWFTVSKGAVSNNTMRKLRNHGDYDPDTKKCVIAAPLIGQLGKNYQGGNDCLISGDELLKMALEKVKEIQNEIGGKFVYLECENVEYLKNFYKNNGFQEFGQRPLDADETDLKGQYLIQLLKYIP